MALVAVVTMGNLVFATSSVVDHDTDYLPLSLTDRVSIEISPYAVDACPGRGDHEMFRRGNGNVIQVDRGKRTLIINQGACWQCKHCTEAIITQYDPLSGITGYYCMKNPGYRLGLIHTTMEARPGEIGYIYRGKPPYCKFFNN